MATGPPVRSEPELDPPQEFVTIMDPVHGSIQLDKYLFKIIDRPEFQRLRKIKQFGGVYYVYSGGVHTRFEHSIGVCYIAGQLVEALNKHCPPKEEKLSEWFTPQEKMCVQIAALCHDIGHGPFSHVYDIAVKEYYKKLKSKQKMKEFITSKEDEYGDNEKVDSYVEKEELPKKAKHEYRSALIVERMMEELTFDKRFEKDKSRYIKLIQDMITFSEQGFDNAEETLPSRKTYKQKAFLFEIVANEFTGIDVDKMDYFARDARSIGLPNSFDWRRFTQTAKIIKCEDGFHHICSRDKDVSSLYELFHTRNVLYRSVYKHKTVVIVEDLIKSALKEATIQVKVGQRSYPLIKCWQNMDAFHLIDDSIEDLIMKEIQVITAKPMQSQQLHIKKARITSESPRRHFSRIKDRKLPKFLGRTKKAKHDDDIESKRKDIAICTADTKSEIKTIEKRLKPLTVKFSYGKGSKDPIESHFFYGKFYPQHPFRIPKEEVSKILPSDFEEEEVFWYYDMKDDHGDETKAIVWECLNTDKLPTELKSALEGSYTRKRKLHEEQEEYTTDKDLRDFKRVIKRYRPK
ncbi:PREDICTED: deoxynucleoside triphosphate triphosphohydrolase SAMHD1-like isoform X2 [Amphimedon queenslandica]|uniref:HD/PDEase domain-containing protein n=1 Tax=Amphimedon queenslandica TaxID=400682 RepID=A0AAN0JLU8_AMPQE|nr:PREDICTED: deoxynucleoside triphosphate triphosphohydrolase SAMHD1-like isoform X2 [Amphimedon queenslandica]|eukprot:XP_019857731.1 PREDICTED: deoxynucleoside triphosphate triphosphohydrolase SAMHD1-like isoform X2 [Amphimedon queenslandica]